MLDRPWLETPFVFQGFEIKDKSEIDQLQSFCGQVFVDIDKGQLTESQIRSLAEGGEKSAEKQPRPNGREARRPGLFGRLALRMGLGALLAQRADESCDGYPITATVRREAPDAARQLIEVGASRTPTDDPATLAAWTIISNQIMNLDECLTK